MRVDEKRKCDPDNFIDQISGRVGKSQFHYEFYRIEDIIRNCAFYVEVKIRNNAWCAIISEEEQRKQADPRYQGAYK